ncbi:MAG: hypothetical protein DRJ65_00905 [Acidobacteria bacterium]|nr:MAG: hypothetical protein DRJ65_00905 [Acidobacteriota bacterium]
MIEDTGFSPYPDQEPSAQYQHSSPKGTPPLPSLFGLFAPILLVLLGTMATMVDAQALTVRSLKGGTEVVLVTQTLAEMSAGCWPVLTENREWQGHCVVGSDLTFTAALEAELGELEEAPSVLIIVGGSGRREAIDLAESVLTGKVTGAMPSRLDRSLEEGGQERRLGQPGGPSILRLEVQFPPVDDADRTAVEVLWTLLPRHLIKVSSGLRTRIEGDVGTLELSVDGDLGGHELRSLRLGLAQVSGDPSLEAEAVERVAKRLRIARSAKLEAVERAGLELLDLWRRGGSDGVRQYLFGPDGVTLERVRQAAGQWLPRHPGHAVFVLPPRHFRPRFAPGPQTSSMSNDLSAAILARPSAQLSTLVLRPVLLSNLTGDAEAAVLTRLATALRRSDNRPAYIAVEGNPPRLEMAAQTGDFPGLCEALQSSMADISSDSTPVTTESDARRTALRLMASILGLHAGGAVTPASVLAPGNLAVGGVAVDSELALEALEKFGVGGSPSRTALEGSVGDVARHRMPAAGTQSAVVVALPLGSGFPIPETIAELLPSRTARLIDGAVAEVLLPLIPGRSVMVIVIVREGEVTTLEEDIEKNWGRLFAPVTEEELGTLRREVAARVVTAAGGVLGRARVCAAIAAGSDSWRTPGDREMAALTVDLVAVNFELEHLAEAPDAQWTASGPATVSFVEQ